MVIRKLINVFRIPDAAQNSTNDFVLRPGIIITYNMKNMALRGRAAGMMGRNW